MANAPAISGGQKCEWFAPCDNDATTWLDGPITTERGVTFGHIPACDRCVQRVSDAESALTRSGN